MVLRLSSFAADVRGVVLAGFSTASAAVVTAADSVLVALGKLQAQVSACILSSTLGAASGTAQLDLNGDLVMAQVPPGITADVGRNLLHNPLFRVQQRGAGAWTTAVYTADRWAQQLSVSTISGSIITLADADRTAIGDEAAAFALQQVVGGTAGAGDCYWLEQRLESVRPTSNKTVTVSFWAKATSGTPKVGVGAAQVFGSGGSPSAAVGINATAVTLSTTWARYQVALALPSVSGKTLGTTAGTDCLYIRFWMSSGATNNTQAGGIGVQSATFQFWGMQCEIAPAASPLEKPDPQQDLAKCQRFYQLLVGQQSVAFNSGAGAVTCNPIIYQPMRATPTIALSSQVYGNGSAVTATPLSATVASSSMTCAAAGGCWAQFNAAINADL